jgi:hypothetical protein
VHVWDRRENRFRLVSILDTHDPLQLAALYLAKAEQLSADVPVHDYDRDSRPTPINSAAVTCRAAKAKPR